MIIWLDIAVAFDNVWSVSMLHSMICEDNDIPAPLHWMKHVKTDIDCDVKLVVIEHVTIWDPVTLCLKVIVIANRNGDIRRTVDLQSLSRHSRYIMHS